jgi:hypothetical protein
MSNDDYKTCPYCGEEIKQVALKCKHCKMLLYDEELLKGQKREEASRKAPAQEALSLIDEDQSSQKSKTNFMFYLIPAAVIVIAAGFVIYIGSNQAVDDQNDTAEIASIEAEEAESISVKVTDSYVVVDVPSTSSLNLRDRPTTAGNILKRLFIDEELKLVGILTNTSNELWVQVISPDGLEGWVHSDYVVGKAKPSTANEIVYDPNLPMLFSYWLYDDQGSFWSNWDSEFYCFYHNHRLDTNLNKNTLIELIGEPVSIEKDAFYYDDDYLTLHYPSMSINCVTFIDSDQPGNIEESYIVELFVHGSDIIGPRGIQVGDSLESLLKRVPNHNNPIEPLQYSYNLNGETVYYQKVLYGSPETMEPYGNIIYNDNNNAILVEFCDIPFGGFGNSCLNIRIKNNRVENFSIGIQIM